MAWVAIYTGVALHWASLVAALVCVVLRFRASRGTERQQMRWVGAGAAAAVIGLLLGVPGALGWLPDATTYLLFAGLLCPPVGVAVAVLRYRLWDLDRLVSRTVTYALVTALLVVPYLLIVLAAGRLVAGSGSLAVAGATLAAAAGFQPLRRRVQSLVDRRFNRRRYDAARTVEGFVVRLRDQVDLDALAAELLAWSTRRCSPPGPGCGSAHRRPHGRGRGGSSTTPEDAPVSTRHPRPCSRRSARRRGLRRARIHLGQRAGSAYPTDRPRGSTVASNTSTLSP